MSAVDERFMRLALRLARRGRGSTSPNPMVGAVITRGGEILGMGWHRQAGLPHAEVEALRDAREKGHSTSGATLFVTLEPCCTTGMTPPCTAAIRAAGIRKVVVGARDPNPRHSGRGFEVLRQSGVTVREGVLEKDCAALNAAFNHWIVQRTPLVTVKAAMTLDGKIATAQGLSKWITSERARAFAMRLRHENDAVAVGINTVIYDDPALTVRGFKAGRQPFRLVLDPQARIPLTARLVNDEHANRTIVVVGAHAPPLAVKKLRSRLAVLQVGSGPKGLDLKELLRLLGQKEVTSLLVEGGGETNASFLLQGLAQRVGFFYAPKLLGGKTARRGVAGSGVEALHGAPVLRNLRWRRVGHELLLQADVEQRRP